MHHPRAGGYVQAGACELVQAHGLREGARLRATRRGAQVVRRSQAAGCGPAGEEKAEVGLRNGGGAQRGGALATRGKAAPDGPVRPLRGHRVAAVEDGPRREAPAVQRLRDALPAGRAAPERAGGAQPRSRAAARWLPRPERRAPRRGGGGGLPPPTDGRRPTCGPPRTGRDHGPAGAAARARGAVRAGAGGPTRRRDAAAAAPP